jgi:hypothetical protein
MSFRWFIYYCAMCGAGGGFAGWMVGRIVVWLLNLIASEPISKIVSDGLKAMWVGMLVAAAIASVDALWVYSLRRFFSVGMRVGTAVFIGTLGGLFGGLIAAVLLDKVAGWQMDTESTRVLALLRLLDWLTRIVGWTITGTLIGISVGTFDLVSTTLRGRDIRPAVSKTIKGLVGGAIGGLIGGVLSLVLNGVWSDLFASKPTDFLWSPSATGFIILGGSIGLLIGLAQIILKEAWLRVEQGFRRGREMILQKGEITIGRAESCDLGLFGDPLVDKLHARILLQNGHYFIVDGGSVGGTFVNGRRVFGPTPLQNGDSIQMGRCVLRFGERAKRQ